MVPEVVPAAVWMVTDWPGATLVAPVSLTEVLPTCKLQPLRSIVEPLVFCRVMVVSAELGLTDWMCTGADAAALLTEVATALTFGAVCVASA